MDLTTLETKANAISSSSPAIKAFALEAVRVAKDQERRLQALEAPTKLPTTFDPAQFNMNQLGKHLDALIKLLRAKKIVG